MLAISGSVGRGGMNLPQDIRTVQTLLNKHRPVPLRPINVDGVNSAEMISGIEEFQRRVVRLSVPDGRVDPGGRTWMALTQSQGASVLPAGSLSGAAWWHANQSKYPNSTSVEDLDEFGFRAKVKEFLASLQQAGASVIISTTRRSKQRAYLMHYSWMIAKGQISASKVPAEPGVTIQWDHGNDAKSKQAAQEMVNLFGMAHIAALSSRHIEGKAIDMTIKWSGTLKIKNKSGQLIEVGMPTNGADNTLLHSVGNSYGVKKLATDAPHWSMDGH